MACLIAIGAMGCSGSKFEGQVYRSDALAFRVGPIPGEWRPVEAEGTLVAFSTDRRGGFVSIEARCGKDGDDVPLNALTRHLFLYFTERQIEHEQTVQLDGRAALRTQLTAKLDGVPRHFTVYVLKKDGCVYDFWLIEPKPDQKRAEEFDSMVMGFSTLR